MLLRLLYFAGTAGTAYGQAGPATMLQMLSAKQDSIHKTNILDEVRVTARWNIEVGALRPAAESIDLSQQKNSGITSVTEALSMHPNVRVSRDAMIGTSVQIGALPSSSTLILLDGVPITGRTDGRIDLSNLTTLGIDRVEIVTGPMAHFYGSGSAAGVVNFVTRHSRQEQQVQTSVSSIGEWQTGLRIAQPRTGTLYAERQFFDGWDPNPEGQRSRAWDQKTTYNLRHSGQLRAKKWILRNHLGGSWDQIKDRGNRRSPFTAFATDRWIETYRARVQGDAWHPNWQVTAAYDAADRSITRYNRNLVERTQTMVQEAGNPDHNRFGDGMIRVAHLSTWRPISGTRLQWRGIGAYHGQLQYLAADRLKEPEMHQLQHGVLAELDLKRTRRQIEIGIRGQWAQNVFSANPSVQWTELYPLGTLRLNASSGFRNPELKERFLWFFDASHQIEGNENLRPERSQQVSASWTSRNRSSAEAHFVQLSDAIQLARQPGGTYTYINLDMWSSASLSLNAPVSVRASKYEIQAQALWSRLGDSGWRPSPSIRLHSTRAMGAYTASVQHQTQWGLWQWNERADGLLESIQLGLTHSAQASIQWKHKAWTLVASGHNLFNQTTTGSDGHATGLAGLPLPGRHLRISINTKWN